MMDGLQTGSSHFRGRSADDRRRVEHHLRMRCGRTPKMVMPPTPKVVVMWRSNATVRSNGPRVWGGARPCDVAEVWRARCAAAARRPGDAQAHC